MRILVLLLAMGSLLSHAENTTSQDNTSIASPSSTVATTQVNPVGELAVSSYGGGVTCSEPTLNVVASNTEMPFGGTSTTTSAIFSVPLGAGFEFSICEKAAKIQNRSNEYRLQAALESQARQEEMHQARMEQEWLKVAKAEAGMAKICMELHKVMSGNPATEVWGLCNKFAPILKDHHKGQPEINTALIPKTHSRFAANKQDRD